MGSVAIAAAMRVCRGPTAAVEESFDFRGMLLLSPGLALFLYGVSSIPAAGTPAAAEVFIPALIGLALVDRLSSATWARITR